MSAPLREQLKNNAQSSLDGGIDGSQTSIDVNDGSVFPATGNFRLICDDEIMLCTARSTNTLTVVRAQEGTSGASHSDGADITHILTAGGLDRMGQDNVALWGYSSLLPLAKIVADDGVTPLVASDFTWVNQGTASVTDQVGTILLRMPTATGENVRAQTRSAPSAPYSYIAAFQCVLPCGDTGDVCVAGLGFRESSTGKLSIIAIQSSGVDGDSCRLSVYNYTSPTVFGTTVRSRVPLNMIGSNAVWMKIEDDNTNLKYYISGDGLEWIQIASQSRTAQMSGGPNQVLYAGNNFGNTVTQNLIRLVHWSRNS